MEIKKLTKAEEEVMQIIWRLKKVFVKDVIAEMPGPKPPYNTISSVVRILDKKGFLGYIAYGKTHQYFPLISKKQYRQWIVQSLLTDYFDGSYSKLMSFFVKKDDFDKAELEQLLKDLDEKDT